MRAALASERSGPMAKAWRQGFHVGQSAQEAL